MQPARWSRPASFAGILGIVSGILSRPALRGERLIARIRLCLAGTLTPPVGEWQMAPSAGSDGKVRARRLRADGRYDYREMTAEELHRFLSADAW